MSRRGEIVVECDGGNCYAEVIYRPENLEHTVDDLLSDDGWKRTANGKDQCPACVADNYEPPEPDGEAFRGREAESFERETQAHVMRDLKR